MKITKNFFTSIKFNFLAFILFILIWLVLSLFFEPYLIPSPVHIFREFGNFFNASFIVNFRITIFRLFTGFVFAYTIGTLIGIAAYKFKIKTTINTLLILFEVIPGIIMGVVFLIILGIGSGVPVFMVALLTLPLIAINTSNALYKTDKLAEEVIDSFSGKTADKVKYIYFPALIPAFVSNLSLGFSLALKIVILGEFIGSQDGIGYLLNVSRIYFNMNEVFFYLLILIIIMFAVQIFFDMVKEVFLKKYFYKE